MAEQNDRNTFTVERSAEVVAPVDRVYGALVDFHEWVHWSPWEGRDPEMARTYRGPDVGVGAVYEWKGNRKVGSGRMEIVDADPPTGLGIRLEFLKPFKARNMTRFTLEPVGDATRVTWTMTGAKTFMSKVMGIFMSMDKMVGGDFDQGLAKLKAHLEG